MNRYKIGDCISFKNGLFGLITELLDKKEYPNCKNIGCELYYPDGFHLAGWDWYIEEEIIGIVENDKRKEMIENYLKQKKEHLVKGYPKDRFIEVIYE